MSINIPFLETAKGSSNDGPNSADVTTKKESFKKKEEGRPVSPVVAQADPQGILRSGKLHPELSRRVESLIETADAKGMKLYLFEGYRSMKRQADLLASGRNVTSAKPGKSFHNYGLAVDIVFQDAKGRPSWAEANDWPALGQIGKDAGLYWGGDWKKQLDRPHFQLIPNEQISKVRQLTNSVGLEKMWETVQ